MLKYKIKTILAGLPTTTASAIKRSVIQRFNIHDKTWYEWLKLTHGQKREIRHSILQYILEKIQEHVPEIKEVKQLIND